MRQLGVQIEHEGTDVIVHGVGPKGLKKPHGPLDCGNSGTTMRLLAGILASQEFESVLTGDASLRLRPMQRIIQPLEKMGASITSEDGLAPLSIRGRGLRGMDHRTPVPSAQIKSCILLAGLFAEGKTVVSEATQSRDHTERMLRTLGVEVHQADVHGVSTCSIEGRSKLAATDIIVPGDISSAAFFIIAAACLPNSDLTLGGVGINPTRSTLLDILKTVGVNLKVTEIGNAPEPIASISVAGGMDAADRTVLDGATVAKIIDEIPILAVLGTRLRGGLEVRGAQELRLKESDRIKAIVDNLRRMGAEVSEFDDGFRVAASRLNAAKVDSRGDHRIAMAFAVAGLLATGETEILGHECADVSYPGFFPQLEAIAVR